MNNCFSAPTAEPPQWGKGASNYSGVGVFTFLFLKLRPVLVPWGAVWVGLGWGLEVSFGLSGFCVGAVVGRVSLFVAVRWLGVGAGQGRKVLSLAGPPSSCRDCNSGAGRDLRGNGGGGGGVVVGIPRTPTILQSCGLGVSPASLQASFPPTGVGRGLLTSFPAHRATLPPRPLSGHGATRLFTSQSSGF